MDTTLAYASAAPLLRCPSCRARALSRVSSGLCCDACGRAVPDAGGWLDFMGEPSAPPTPGERIFQSPLIARGYDMVREGPGMRLLSGKSFRQEIELLSAWLTMRPDARLLDVPCGQGNFTAALARCCPQGVVIAADISSAQLALARDRFRRERIRNVVLVRASALDLPISDAAIDAVSNCGGLHLYPDVPRAIGEMRRVLKDGGAVAGLTLLLRRDPLSRLAKRVGQLLSLAQAFDFDALGEQFQQHGFADWQWEGWGIVAWFRAVAR